MHERVWTIIVGRDVVVVYEEPVEVIQNFPVVLSEKSQSFLVSVRDVVNKIISVDGFSLYKYKSVDIKFIKFQHLFYS